MRRDSFHAPRECRGGAFFRVPKVIALVPFQHTVDALCAQELFLCFDTVSDLRHDGVFRPFLAITEAQIDMLRANLLPLRKLDPMREPHRRRRRRNGGKAIGLKGAPQRKQTGKVCERYLLIVMN